MRVAVTRPLSLSVPLDSTQGKPGLQSRSKGPGSSVSAISMPRGWKASQPLEGRHPDGGPGRKDSRGLQEMLVPVDLQASQDSLCSNSEAVTGALLGHGRLLQHQFTQHTTATSTHEEGSTRASGPEALLGGSVNSRSLRRPKHRSCPQIALLLPSQVFGGVLAAWTASSIASTRQPWLQGGDGRREPDKAASTPAAGSRTGRPHAGGAGVPAQEGGQLQSEAWKPRPGAHGRSPLASV